MRQQDIKRLKRLPFKQLCYFVAGFVDGEGSFSISLKRAPSKKYEKGWYWVLDPVFQVYQHEDNLQILLLLKEYVFKTGRVHRKTSPYHVFTYSIENQKTLQERIVPFFKKYPLGTKAETFEKFAAALKKMNKKEHLSYKGFCEILDIAFNMNAFGKQRKFSKTEVLETLAEQFNV